MKIFHFSDYFLVLEISFIAINILIVWKKKKKIKMCLLTLNIVRPKAFIYHERPNSPKFNISYQ